MSLTMPRATILTNGKLTVFLVAGAWFVGGGLIHGDESQAAHCHGHNCERFPCLHHPHAGQEIA